MVTKGYHSNNGYHGNNGYQGNNAYHQGTRHSVVLHQCAWPVPGHTV